MAATGRVSENWVYQTCAIKETPLRWPSCQRCLPPSPAIGCSTCDSNSCARRMTNDAQKHLGDTCRGGSSKFALDRLQGHKNPARERGGESPCSRTSEGEKRV